MRDYLAYLEDSCKEIGANPSWKHIRVNQAINQGQEINCDCGAGYSRCTSCIKGDRHIRNFKVLEFKEYSSQEARRLSVQSPMLQFEKIED